MRTSKTEKIRREALLTAQGQTCALCHDPMPTAFRMLLIEKQNAIVCRACGQFMSVYTKSVRRGVTPEALAVFLAQPPAPEPTVTTAERLKLKPEQLATGQKLFDGSMTIGDRNRIESIKNWCSRVDCTLVQYEMEFGLVKDTQTRTEPPDRMFVDGEWCEVVDEAWIPIESE